MQQTPACTATSLYTPLPSFSICLATEFPHASKTFQYVRGAVGSYVYVFEPLGPRDDIVNSQSKPGAHFPSGLLTNCVVRAQKSETRERCHVMGAATPSTSHVSTVI